MPNLAEAAPEARNPWAPPQAVEFRPRLTGNRNAFISGSLARRLDCILDALPVRRRSPGPRLVAAIAKIDPKGSLVLRAIRLADGRRVDLVVVPRACERDPTCVEALRALQIWRRRAGRPLRLIREETVGREPRLGNAQLIGICRDNVPSPFRRRKLLQYLRDNGGSAPLLNCLASLAGEVDPASAILALVACRVLQVDLDRPLGPQSWVRLGPFLTFSA